MKKNLKRIILSVLVLTLLMFQTVVAADSVDDSYLTDEESSTGIMEVMPYGAYLQSGYSNISKQGTGLVRAGGTTMAQTTVGTVKVSVMVERLVGGNWLQYDFWTATKYNADYVTSAKTITVPVGYYYRTRCIHSANSDSSSSVTNGLSI